MSDGKTRHAMAPGVAMVILATGCSGIGARDDGTASPSTTPLTSATVMTDPAIEDNTSSAAPSSTVEAPATTASSESVADEGLMTPKEVAAANIPATVHIFTDTGSGSGFVIDRDEGIVVTNAHVVSGAGLLKAGVSTGEQVSARLLGAAPCEDLAVVQLNEVPESVTEVVLGSARSLVNQDEVTAIGFPAAFGNANTQRAVTSSGAVQSPSLSAEPDSTTPLYAELIQHDAAVNPGNSGGPLFNDHGEVVGINTLSNTQENGRIIQQQYYAITVDRAQMFIDDLRSGKSINDIGLEGGAYSEVDLSTDPEGGAQVQEALLNSGYDGLYVYSTTTGGPADDANIFAGDFILEVRGVAVTRYSELCDVLESVNSGETVEVTGMYLSSGTDFDLYDRWTANVTMP